MCVPSSDCCMCTCWQHGAHMAQRHVDTSLLRITPLLNWNKTAAMVGQLHRPCASPGSRHRQGGGHSDRPHTHMRDGTQQHLLHQQAEHGNQLGEAWCRHTPPGNRLPPSPLSEGSIVKAGAGRAGPRVVSTTLGCCTTCTKTQPFQWHPSHCATHPRGDGVPILVTAGTALASLLQED